MIWRKLFWENMVLGGWWFGVVWTGWSSIFPKHPFRQEAVFNLFLFKSYWQWSASAACNQINSVAQASATTFAFPPDWFLFHVSRRDHQMCSQSSDVCLSTLFAFYNPVMFVLIAESKSIRALSSDSFSFHRAHYSALQCDVHSYTGTM